MRKIEMERLLSLISLFLVYVALAVEVVSLSFGRPLCSSDDTLALLQFKKSLAMTSSDYPLCQSSYPKTTSWNRSSMDCCRWNGVTCDSFTGHVIRLDLSCSEIGGTIHPNSSLFHLHHLQTLDLSFNNFSGSQIPTTIGQLVSLVHLNLSYCFLQGKIPLEISHLSKLISLDLSDDAPNLLQLNQFGFRMFFQNLTRLEVLSLFNVDISSKISSSIINVSSSLRYLDLEETKLYGDLPKSIFLLSNLETLRLSANDLTVSFPKSNWSSSHTLTEIDISYNNVSGGVLPAASLGSFKALKIVKLSQCNLVGSIPESISNLSQVTELDLSYNHLESKIPDVVSNLEKLEFLSLSDNSLSGPLPLTTNGGGLQNLKDVDLSRNSLNCSIPSWMISLPSLIHLTLESNHFSGLLPEFKPNSSLRVLDLFQNQLVGPIPQSLRHLLNLSVLALGSNNLSGEVGAEMLSSMTKLHYLELSSNSFSGEIGAETFSGMTNLRYLDLSHSGLSWSSSNNDNTTNVISTTIHHFFHLNLAFCRVKDFPDFLLNSEELVILNLSGNEIHGDFPKWFEGLNSLQVLNLTQNHVTSLNHLPWQTMTVVDLQSNSLKGPLPSSFCQPNNLDLLNLSYNNLSGEIPICFFISKTLSVLELRGNNFHGPIPNIFSRGNGLHHIGLSKNQLEGPIPRSLINCTYLQVLDLGNNKIHSTFPTWLEMLNELEILVLKSNRFYGPVVAFQTKSPFPNLRIFDLSDNSFTGSLPVEGFKAMMKMDEHKSKLEYMEEKDSYFGNYTDKYEESVTLVMKNQEIILNRILKIFTTIDLSRNNFEGEIPKFIGNLNSLVLLNLSHNNLTGHIPVEMKNMSTLEALDLSFNKLIGKIPEELTILTFLAVLNLSHNHLVGPIPHSNQFNTFPNDSYFGNADLCGFPLSHECGHHKTASVPGLLVEEKDDEPSFLSEMTWSSVLIGYGCGLIFGFIIGYFIYRFQRPRWFIHFFATLIHELTYTAQRAGRRRRRNRRH
nr:PREDICTED: receptor-like protein 12 [Nicotiana sylvestris]